MWILGTLRMEDKLDWHLSVLECLWTASWKQIFQHYWHSVQTLIESCFCSRLNRNECLIAAFLNGCVNFFCPNACFFVLLFGTLIADSVVLS